MKEYVPLRKLVDNRSNKNNLIRREKSKSFQVNLDLIKKEQLIDEDQNTSR